VTETVRSEAAWKVLEAASELFYRDGIRATGVEAVVERSGVTKMTLYKHFGSKDGLVVAYLERRDGLWRERLARAVERRVAEKGDRPEERMLAVFDALEEWLRTEEARGCAFINATAELPDPEHPAREVIRRQQEAVRSHFEELAAEAGVHDPGRLAGQLMILYEGAIVTAVSGGVSDPIGSARAVAGGLLGL